jgi:hypothetical protein
MFKENSLLEAAREILLEAAKSKGTVKIDSAKIKSELARIQRLFDQADRGKVKINTKFKIEKDGYINIDLEVKGLDEDIPAYISLAPAEGYEEMVGMGIDAEEVFIAYKYSADSLAKIKLNHVKAFLKLADTF